MSHKEVSLISNLIILVPSLRRHVPSHDWADIREIPSSTQITMSKMPAKFTRLVAAWHRMAGRLRALYVAKVSSFSSTDLYKIKLSEIIMSCQTVLFLIIIWGFEDLSDNTTLKPVSLIPVHNLFNINKDNYCVCTQFIYGLSVDNSWTEYKRNNYLCR